MWAIPPHAVVGVVVGGVAVHGTCGGSRANVCRRAVDAAETMNSDAMMYGDLNVPHFPDYRRKLAHVLLLRNFR